MLDRFKKDVGVRLTAIFIMGCMIPLFFFGVYIYFKTVKNLVDMSRDRVSTNIQLREHYIHSWIEAQENSIEEIAELYKHNVNIPLSKNDIISFFIKDNSEFFEIFILSTKDGNIIQSTEPLNIGKIKKERAYFHNGIKGTYTSNIYFSPSLQGPAMTIATPIEISGDTLLVLAGRVKLDKLISVLGLGFSDKTSINSYLVNRWNAFTIGSDKVEEKTGNFSFGIQKAIEEGRFIGKYKDWNGTTVIGCCRFISTLGAVLVVEVEYDLATSPLKKDIVVIFAILIASILIASFFFYFLLKNTLKPIDEISKAAQTAAQGNLNVRVRSKGMDQIALLASSFNSMVSKLADSLHEKALSDQKRSHLIERANDGFITIDRFGNILDINQSVSRMWNYTQVELKQMLVFELFQEDDAKTFGRQIRRIEYNDSAGLIELNAVKQNGVFFPTEMSLISLGDGTYLVIARDITEKKILERELVQAQKLESVGTLAAGIAHDFDNLLVGVLGAASLIKSTTNNSDPRYEMLEIIETSAERAAGLVKQLMTFARQEPPHRETTNISTLIEEVMRVLRTSGSPDIFFRTRVASNLPMVFVDPVQIKQTFFNLCLNAIDAMPDGGELTVEVNFVEVDSSKFKTLKDSRNKNFVEILISDTGIGISEDKIDRIFEPFFSTKGPGKGTGLGLSISYGIVEFHGGAINVDSVEGIGSTFRVYLPALSHDVNCPIEQKPSIFFIDKNPSLRRLYRVALDGGHYSLLSFSSLNMALLETKKSQLHPDIILLGSSALDDDLSASLYILKTSFPKAARILLGEIEGISEIDFDEMIPEYNDVKKVLEALGRISSNL
ncbi:PAS domain S-box protein [bacterium]|nr:PAS domain S-box protein [bacterium]